MNSKKLLYQDWEFFDETQVWGNRRKFIKPTVKVA